jgi:hypothetical protein
MLRAGYSLTATSERRPRLCSLGAASAAAEIDRRREADCAQGLPSGIEGDAMSLHIKKIVDIYGANLQPPAGYVFDAAIVTTFSLDFETALAVPVSLALFAAENRDDILTHPLALLEGAERIAGRLLVFTDAGHIQAHRRGGCCGCGCWRWRIR